MLIESLILITGVILGGILFILLLMLMDHINHWVYERKQYRKWALK